MSIAGVLVLGSGQLLSARYSANDCWQSNELACAHTVVLLVDPAKSFYSHCMEVWKNLRKKVVGRSVVA